MTSHRMFLTTSLATLVLGAASVHAATVLSVNFETSNGVAPTDTAAVYQIDDASGNGHHFYAQAPNNTAYPIASANLPIPGTDGLGFFHAADTAYTGHTNNTYAANDATNGYTNGGDFNMISQQTKAWKGVWAATPGTAFNTAIGGNMQKFDLSFNLASNNNFWGGSAWIAGVTNTNASNGQPNFGTPYNPYTNLVGMKGWTLQYDASFSDTQPRIVLQTGDSTGATSALYVSFARQFAWLTVSLSVTDGSDAGHINATLTVRDGSDNTVLGTASGTDLVRPAYDNYIPWLLPSGPNNTDSIDTGHGIGLDNFNLIAVPEPATLGLLTLGGLMIGVRGHRR